MKKDAGVYLEDIIDCSQKIAEYITGKTSFDFQNDDLLQDAVIRRLEVIGEAIKRLPSDIREQYPAIEWKKAAGMRDILIHHYEELDIEQIWVTATQTIPEFSEQIKLILKELDNSD